MGGDSDGQIRGHLCALAGRSDRLLGRGGQGDSLGQAGARDLQSRSRRLWPLVHRRDLQHLLQRARPPRCGRPCRRDGDHLRQPGHRHQAQDQLSRASRRCGDLRRRACRSRHRQGRPRHHLHADDSRGDRRHAGLRAAGGDPFGRLRRLRRSRARQPHQRCAAEADRHRLLRRRAHPRRSLPAAGKRGSRAGHPQAGNGDRRPARSTSGRARSVTRSRLCARNGQGEGRRTQRDMGRGCRHRSALHPLHIGHHRSAQGHHPRQWWPHGRPRLVDDLRLRRRPGRGLLGGVGHRLGGRPFLHRLCAAHSRLYDGSVRGQARGHARRRGLLASDCRAQRVGAVHGADRAPRHQEGRPGRGADRPPRPVQPAQPVPRRRAGRSRTRCAGPRRSSVCR